MDKQHNWLMSQVAEGEEATGRIDDKAAGVRDEWFRIGHAFLAAKELYPSTQAFGEWLRSSPLARWEPDDRSCAMRLAKHESFARKALEGTAVATARAMWGRVAELFSLATSQRCELDSDVAEESKNADSAAEARENARDSEPKQTRKHRTITPHRPGRKSDLEKAVGDDAGARIRGWYKKGHSLAAGILKIIQDKPIIEAVAAAVDSEECRHAAVAGSDIFDIRMVFPHIPEAVAKAVGRNRTWKELKSKSGGREKSDWERFAELNDLCRDRSAYSVDKPAPNGAYMLREQKHEDEIGHCARQWWHSGHWPGDAPPLQVLAGGKAETAPSAPVSGDATVYYGMTLWPLDPAAWRKPDDPVVPTKTDVDNTYWFVEELHRALVARGVEHRIAARYIRNWSKYIGALQKPAAAAAVMQDMAQGIDTFAQQPNSGLDLTNKMPSRPTRFAAEG